MSTPAVDPHVLPSGSCPQFLITVGFGFGSVPLAGSTTSVCVNALPADNATTTTLARSASLERPETDMAASIEKRSLPVQSPNARTKLLVSSAAVVRFSVSLTPMECDRVSAANAQAEQIRARRHAVDRERVVAAERANPILGQPYGGGFPPP